MVHIGVGESGRVGPVLYTVHERSHVRIAYGLDWTSHKVTLEFRPLRQCTARLESERGRGWDSRASTSVPLSSNPSWSL